MKEKTFVYTKAYKFLRSLMNFTPYIMLAVGGFVMVYPLIFSLLGSFATVQEYREAVFLPIPKTPLANLENFVLVFKTGKGITGALIITFSRMILGLVMSVFVSAFGGYIFAKINFKFKRTVFTVLLSSMMIPGVAMMVPGFIWMTKFPLVGGNNIFGSGGNGFVNNPLVLFVTGWVNVYAIFLFRQSFVSLGNEMAESGEMDGASFFRIVVQLYFPLVKPIIAVMFLGSFLGNWNDYMTSIIYLPNKPEFNLLATTASALMEHYTNPLRAGGPDYPKAFAISTVMMIPPIIVYIFVQKQFVEGLAMGAVKG